MSVFVCVDGDVVSVLCNSVFCVDDLWDVVWGLVCVNWFLIIVRFWECCKKYENKIYIELCFIKYMVNLEDKLGLVC